jgi:hypothetical protein
LATKYKTNTTATIYFQTAGGFDAAGTMESNKTLSIEPTNMVTNGILLAKITGNDAPSFTLNNGKSSSSKGYFIPLAQLTVYTETSSTGASVNALTGTYKVTTLATVYKDSTDYMEEVGHLGNTNARITFSSTKEVKGVTYGKIGGSAPVYIANIDTKTYSAAGFYLSSAQVTKVESNGTSTISATDNTGSTVSLKNVVTFDDGKRPVYTVNTGYSWSVYTLPSSTEGSLVKTYSAGQTIQIYATVKDSAGNVWGCTSSTSDRWGLLMPAKSLTVTSALKLKNSVSDVSGTIQTTSSDGSTTTVEIGDRSEKTTTRTSKVLGEYTNAQVDSSDKITDASWDVYNDMDSISTALYSVDTSSNMSSDALEALSNMQYVIGIPPKITQTADHAYLTGASPSNNFGRCYTEMFMMGNTVFSVQPCKVKYLPDLNSSEKETFFNQVVGLMGNDSSATSDSDLSGQLFEAQPDYNDYINTVNLLARVMAVFLGIGDKKYMNTSTKYRDMDYSWYKIKTTEKATTSSNGIMGVIDSVTRAVADAFGSVINDDTYLHFYMTADGSSQTESMTVTTKSSSLESLFNNGLSALGQEIQFLGGNYDSTDSAIDNIISTATSAVDGTVGQLGDVGATISNMLKYGGNYLRGGRLVFPQMLDDCSYDRSYRVSCRFISPSGNAEAIFLNCYLPLCYLLPYALPQMLSDNMYRYPFLARCDVKGQYHADLAAITSLNIQRGGQDGNCWTSDGLPFEIDVSFDVTPLYSKLMVTSTRHPVLFMSNSALHEYLGAMCGISFTGNTVWDLKLNLLKILGGNYITDTIPSMLRSFYSSGIANAARKFFNFGT